MVSLIEKYYQYYTNYSKENAQQLLNEIKQYGWCDFLEFNEQAWTLPYYENSSFINMYSTGTTGKPVKYKFGPNENLISEIETLIKTDRPIVFLQNWFFVQQDKWLDRSFLITENKDWIRLNFLEPEIFINIFQGQQISIKSYPNSFLFLLRNHVFVKAVIENNWQLVTTDYDGFIPKVDGIVVNDNMVDWRSGRNFYTCPQGTKHCLPIWSSKDGKVRNLLNLCEKETEESDLFEFEETPKICYCGKPYLPIKRFIPHIKHAIVKPNGDYLYDLELATKLKGSYWNMQFVQQDDKIQILYASPNEMPKEDITTLTTFLKGNEFDNIEFVPDSYMVTGGLHKLGVFYKNIKNQPIKHWSKPPKIMLISVIMPVFNGIAFLDQSIKSILNQTYPDFEFIIIDDCSTEPVWDLLNSYKDNRIIKYRNTRNIGLTNSLNLYLDSAKGDYIARHDGDDVAQPTRFQAELKAFEPDVGLVSCWTKAIDSQGNFIKSEWEDVTAKVTSDQIQQKLKKNNCIVAPGAIFRKEVIKTIGYFDETLRLAQDYNYWLRLEKYFKIKIIEKELVWKRTHKNNVWKTPQTIDWCALARQRAENFPYIKRHRCLL